MWKSLKCRNKEWQNENAQAMYENVYIALVNVLSYFLALDPGHLKLSK